MILPPPRPAEGRAQTPGQWGRAEPPPRSGLHSEEAPALALRQNPRAQDRARTTEDLKCQVWTPG